MRARVMVVAGVGLGLLAVGGCGSASSGTNGSASGTLSKGEICAKALGTVALSEVGDDFQRKANAAKDAADALRKLSTQTQDRSLSQALSAAAQEAGSAVGKRWSSAMLKEWAGRVEARFDAIRKAC